EPTALHPPKHQHLVAEVDDFFGLVLKLAQFGNPLSVVAEASLPTAIDRIEPEPDELGKRDRLKVGRHEGKPRLVVSAVQGFEANAEGFSDHRLPQQGGRTEPKGYSGQDVCNSGQVQVMPLVH